MQIHNFKNPSYYHYGYFIFQIWMYNLIFSEIGTNISFKGNNVNSFNFYLFKTCFLIVPEEIDISYPWNVEWNKWNIK